MTQAITKAKVFVDSSALISAIISAAQATPMTRLIALGEKDVVDLRISREVTRDAERFVRELASELGTNPDEALLDVATAITLGNMATVPDPDEKTIAYCDALIGYRPDARILAAAIECNADVLVTHDSKHLVGNPKIIPPAVSVMVMRPKDCLNWCYEQWKIQLGRSG